MNVDVLKLTVILSLVNIYDATNDIKCHEIFHKIHTNKDMSLQSLIVKIRCRDTCPQMSYQLLRVCALLLNI